MRAAQPACADQVAHFFHRILHAQRLLVEEGAGAGRALAAAVVVQDAAVFQADVLRAFAADLEDRLHVRVEGAHHARDGFELVLEVEAENFGDGAAAGAGDADAFDAVFRHGLVEFVQQVVGGLDGAAGDAPVFGKHQRAAVEGVRRKAGLAAQRASRMGRSSGLPRAAILRLIAPMSRPILMPISVQFDARQR